MITVTPPKNKKIVIVVERIKPRGYFPPPSFPHKNKKAYNRKAKFDFN
jgi:hypothetical protein